MFQQGYIQSMWCVLVTGWGLQYASRVPLKFEIDNFNQISFVSTNMFQYWIYCPKQRMMQWKVCWKC